MSSLEPQDPKKPSHTRLMLWIGVAGVGVYSIIQGVIGIMQHG
ncbi:hypothetical protein [Glaciihabitans sp. INWT7]|nr:hypothetical protein [Glaciihabitans sp. INWT7]